MCSFVTCASRVAAALDAQGLRFGLAGAAEHARPVPRDRLGLEAGGRGDDERHQRPRVVELGAEADRRLGRRVRLLQRKVADPALERELLRAGQHEVDRLRGGGRCSSSSRSTCLRRRARRTVTMLRYRTGCVWCLRPNTKIPTATTGEQADSCDQPPPPLYGAEDVLNAQDSSSALKHRGERPADPHPCD